MTRRVQVESLRWCVSRRSPPPRFLPTPTDEDLEAQAVCLVIFFLCLLFVACKLSFQHYVIAVLASLIQSRAPFEPTV